jgi:hypothetical protein
MITFRCTHCSVLIQTHDRWVGKPITCRQCRHVAICPPTSILAPLRTQKTPRPKRKVGNPEFFAALGAIGLVCLAWAIIV